MNRDRERLILQELRKRKWTDNKQLAKLSVGGLDWRKCVSRLREKGYVIVKRQLSGTHFQFRVLGVLYPALLHKRNGPLLISRNAVAMKNGKRRRINFWNDRGVKYVTEEQRTRATDDWIVLE